MVTKSDKECSCGNKIGKNNKSGLCSKCYVKQYQKDYFKKHPDIKKERLEKFHKFNVCKILKKHSDDLKNDPEHLTTKFIRSLINETDDDLK